MPSRPAPRWAYSFRSAEKLRDEERAGEAGGDPCSRDVFCSGRRILLEDGERKIIPARTYGAFCPACEGLIRSCLAELPAAYVRLGAETAELHRRNVSGHSPFGPRLPFDASYDELQRSIAEVLLSWEERTRTVARLSVLDTQLSRRRDQAEAVTQAAQILGAHLTALLALGPEPMMRSLPARSMPDDVTMLELGGRDAGDEVLALHRRALLVLGEIVRQRERLDGIPCRECEAMCLVRAEPPSDPEREAMHSLCTECGDMMDRAEFGEWSARYAKWAESSGVTCRRCQGGRCAECQWRACSCAASGHVAALCAA
jgi:hypothetical protein